ncbi:leucine permease transcriptional regulator [Venturia nashicola]|uniref:Leucine permease transcriptional regulator n=1 Tax=Venturia nashicola TaxID=86259 RepID=A0A4Z1P5S2_9PEZI|nr:leucine permease transcriptional regulator [Venturia nashicola]TLD30122.1 leucine permease transcriptional regulator [Venturia nashicola]
MSVSLRSGRGGKGGRGGSKGGSRSTNGSEDEGGGRGFAGRGRANGTANDIRRGINKTLQQGAQGSHTPPRGPRKSTPSTYGKGGGASNGSSSPARNLSTSGSTSGSYEERFNKLKELRIREIDHAIANGLMDDPLHPRELSNAITIVGRCQDLCPEFERMERITQNQRWLAELVRGEDGKPTQIIDESRMVKSFRRSAAGKGDQPPSELRPPEVLKRTADYLFDTLINESGLKANQTFIWDRTRAIRNDFSIQQLTRTPDLRLAIECYEQMVRFHVVSMHYVGTLRGLQAPSGYSYQQDREQFDKTLLSLLRYYDNTRDRYRSPHEPELRACWIIFQIQNNIADLEDQVQTWPAELIRHPKIQHALSVYAAACEVIDGKGPFFGRNRTNILIAQQNWGRFWKLVGSKQVSYLLSCVAEFHFNTIRRIVLQTILSAHQPGSRINQDWTLNDVRCMLAFDNRDDTQDFLQHYRIQIKDRDDYEPSYVDFASVPERSLPTASNDLPPQYFSKSLVERKKYGRTPTAIIQGLSVKEAREQKKVEEPEESLFVGELSDEEKATRKPVKKVQFSTNVSTFTPTPRTTSPPSTIFSGFGQRSTLSSSAPSSFGQPSTSASTFGQPSSTFGTTANSQSVSPFGQKSLGPATNGNGGFNFGGNLPTPASGGTTAMPQTTTVPPASPCTQFNGTTFKQPSSLNLGTNSLQRPLSVNGSKPSAFGTPLNPFGFPPIQTIGNENEEPKVPDVQVIAPSEKSSSSTPLRHESASYTNGTAPASTLSSTPSSTPSITATPMGPPSTSFSEYSKAPRSSVPASTPPVPPLSSNITQQPAQPTPSQTTATGATGKLPLFPLHGEGGMPPQPPQPAQGSGASGLPSTAPSMPVLGGATLAAILPEPPNTKARESAAWDYVARQLLLHPAQGFLKQYMEHVAAPMISQAMKEHEEEMDREKADVFRWHILARRYFFWWKWSATEMRDKRIGRERRERLAAEKKVKAQRAKEEENRKRTEELRRREESDDHEFDIFRRNLEQGRRTSQQQLDLEHGSPAQQQLTKLNGSESLVVPTIRSVSRPESLNSKDGRTSVRSHKRSRTQPDASSMMLPPNNKSHRVSKASRQPSPTLSNASTRSNRSSILGASMLSGASILDSLGMPVGTRLSTMSSNYFNNKALGLQPILSKSQSRLVQAGTKRARTSDDFNTSTGSFTENSPPGRKKRFEPSFSPPVGDKFSEQRTHVVPPPLRTSTSSQAADILPEDEALFARVRAVTQAMDQSINELKEDLAKEELRQSQYGSSYGSSSPIFRLSGSGSSRPRFEESTSSLFNSLPAYMNRSSRFVPREDYGKRPQKRAGPPKESEKGKSNAATVNGFISVNGGTRPLRQQQPTSQPSPAPAPQKSAPIMDIIDLDSD